MISFYVIIAKTGGIMKKDYDVKKYKDTVLSNKDFFKKHYYHSIIDLNLVKLDYILKYGILSKNFIEKQNNISIYTHQKDSYDSKNGYDYISLSEYNNNTEFVNMFESFTLHTLTSLSLLIDKDIKIEEKGKIETFFDDEIFCRDIITNEHIKGILIPQHLTNKYIYEISCLPNDLECYTYKYINHWIDEIERYFKKETSRTEIIESLKIFKSIISEYERPERWVVSALDEQQQKYGEDLKDILARNLHKLWSNKLNILNPTYIDVITELNKENLDIYEIQIKELKKIK